MSEERSLNPGLTGRASLVVGPEHTARHLGSGTLDVFATPMMVALMEAAAVDCVESRLGPDEVSLGTLIEVAHRAATPIGAGVTAVAELSSVDGRTLKFRVIARDDHGVIGDGVHTRVIVTASRFLGKLATKRAETAAPGLADEA